MNTVPNHLLDRLHQTALRLFAERGTSRLSVSELAEAAGVARGTIYNNLTSPETLFEDLALWLSNEMHERITKSLESVQDPAVRVANGIRFFIRRAHEEPYWGRFLIRFALSDAGLRRLWTGPPATDLMNGIKAGRYVLGNDQIPTVLGLIAGATVSAIYLVLEGHRTWREAGADTAEFVLRAIGIAPKEARTLAMADLPPLPTRAAIVSPSKTQPPAPSLPHESRTKASERAPVRSKRKGKT
jgi:AcrR family transcriptional regulator